MLSVADTDLLRDGCATVMKGQVVGLVGGNGCGKSTLLKCIAGRRAVDDGAVVISTDLEVGYFEQTAVSGSVLTVGTEVQADPGLKAPPGFGSLIVKKDIAVLST